MEAEERQTRSREKKAHQEKVAGIESDILRHETRLKELTAQLEDPATYTSQNVAELNRELLGLTELLGVANKEWESLAEDRM